MKIIKYEFCDFYFYLINTYICKIWWRENGRNNVNIIWKRLAFIIIFCIVTISVVLVTFFWYALEIGRENPNDPMQSYLIQSYNSPACFYISDRMFEPSLTASELYQLSLLAKDILTLFHSDELSCWSTSES